MTTQVLQQPLEGHRTALTFLVLAYMLSVADRMILSILFPDIKAEFNLTDTQLGLLGGLTFALFYACLGLPIARLADQYSRKRIIVLSLITFSLMTALSGLATGFLTLLLFRVGVGVGEAGVNPSSHSIIADYYPAHRRSFAMALLGVGASAGMMLGFAGGGIVAEIYSWRIALMSIGLPGLVLAIVMVICFKEPKRGQFQEVSSRQTDSSVWKSTQFMWRQTPLRHLVIGSTISGMFSYGITQWLPTLFIRSHGMSAEEVGIMMAAFFGILGMMGALVSGKITDKLSVKGFQYGPWLIAGTSLLAVPFWLAALLADSLSVALWLLVIPAFTANFFLGPSLALIQTLSPVSMRAVASAINMLCINLIGLGLGPLVIGILSDLLLPKFGTMAINYAIAMFSLIAILGAFHYYRCGKLLATQQTH